MRSFVMVVVTLVAMAIARTSSVHGECSTVNDLSQYKSCMPAVVGTTPALPTTECCDAIKKADITCLCTAVVSSNIPELNQDAAIMLPKKCGVIPPGLSTCGKHGNPFARKLMDLHEAFQYR